MEESVFFDCDGIKLEGLFNKGENNKGVVVTHPHPLYGGNMHNNVVDSIARVYGAAGFSTLRFNFRGVGRSGGSHDNGDAEQDDLAAAMEFLLSNGLEIVDFAGYSFGTWVVAHYALDTSVQGDIVFVSPPAAFMDFSEIDSMPNLKFVVSGARDFLHWPGTDGKAANCSHNGLS